MCFANISDFTCLLLWRFLFISCSFFIQRAANTGGGPQDRRWGHEKFEGDQEGYLWGNKDSSSRATGSGRSLEGHTKRSDPREEKRSRRYDIEKPREDHNRREERRSMWHHTDELEPNSREESYSREENRSRRHGGDDNFEARSREDDYRREERRSTRRESESYLRVDRDRRGGDNLSSWHGDSSSHHHSKRDDTRYK